MTDDPRIKQLRSTAEACKRKKRNMVQDMDTNVDYRRGKPFAEDSDSDRIAVNVDFPLTKAKQATLFSQMPQAVLTAKHAQFAPAAPVFGKAVNDALEEGGTGAAMFECMSDLINMAGYAGVVIAYEALEDTVDMPLVDPALLPPEQQAAVMSGAVKIPTTKVKRVRDQRITVTRISPKYLLWDPSFKGSDFNKSPVVGYTGTMPWVQAKRVFKLKDEHKDDVIGSDSREHQLANEQAEDNDADQKVVTFDELYYWRHLYHEDEMSFTAIQRVVFVAGITEPVIDEPWTGQKMTEDGSYLGSCLRPVQFCTLTYISDDPIPPSDSAVGRPQVEELNRSRTQMFQQRGSSKPVLWFNDQMVDPETRDLLLKGTWQGMIPVMGDGNRMMGAVARAQYPQEDFAFDRVTKGDLQEQWGLGSNQLGTFASGERSASEATIVEQNNQTRQGQERNRVVDFFLRTAAVVAGLLALYGDFEMPTELGAEIGPDGQQRLATWDRESVNQKFAFAVRADSTVLLDSEQRIQRAFRAFNFLQKAPGSDTRPIMREIAELSGFDPMEVVKDPQPPPPELPKISYSFKGEDLLNPMCVALIMTGGRMPTPDELEAAKAIVAASLPPGMGPAPSPTAGAATNLPTSEPPPTENAAPAHYDANPEHGLADRINTRRDGGSL
jgi:hypothetical protein